MRTYFEIIKDIRYAVPVTKEEALYAAYFGDETIIHLLDTLVPIVEAYRTAKFRLNAADSAVDKFMSTRNDAIDSVLKNIWREPSEDTQEAEDARAWLRDFDESLSKKDFGQVVRLLDLKNGRTRHVE